MSDKPTITKSQQNDINIYTDYIFKEIEDSNHNKYHTVCKISEIKFCIAIYKVNIHRHNHQTEMIEYNYKLEFTNQNCYLNESDDTQHYVNMYNIEDKEKLINQLLLIVNEYRYSKITNMLVPKEIRNGKVLEQKLFKSSDKCAVCFDYCFTTTKCNHIVCLYCLEKLRVKEDNKCPLCRQCLLCGDGYDCCE